MAALDSGVSYRHLAPADFPSELAEHLPFDGHVIRRPTRRISGSADLPKAPFEIQDVSFGHDWYAEAEGYRRISLWLFHVLFSGYDFAGLRLSHDQSQIRELWVLVERPVSLLKYDAPARVIGYDYYGRPPIRHAFFGDDRIAQDADRPLFRFGWSNDAGRFKADPCDADQIILAISTEGLAAFAALLLDFASPWSDLDEINLEPPFTGFGGTRPLSLEARFWRPGSFGFWAQSLEELNFDDG